MPLKKEESVLKSVPQEKSPAFQVSLPVVALQVWRLEPKSWEEEEYEVVSKGREEEVPVVLKVVLPIDRVPLAREMVVLASTFIALVNSSKSRELEVTNLVPAGRMGTVLKVH